MADGVQAAPRQDALVTANGSRMLKTSKGRARVKLDDLGPAIFNRMGADTCGRHCLKLLTRIVKVEGFATYRYVAAWCHEPDPHAPLVVAEHGNKMGSRDGLLPKYRIEPLKGLFAKTHLATALLAVRQGRFPALMDIVKKNPGDHVDLMEALTDGIYVEVFPWAAVQANRGAFLELMASDNFDHAHGMVESEILSMDSEQDLPDTALVTREEAGDNWHTCEFCITPSPQIRSDNAISAERHRRGITVDAAQRGPEETCTTALQNRTCLCSPPRGSGSACVAQWRRS